MPEKPEETNNPEKKPLPDQGQEASAVKEQGRDQTGKASQKMSESAWSPGKRPASSFEQSILDQSMPAGFPQPEIVGAESTGVSILEGQLIKPGDLRPTWTLSDQQVEDLAKQIRTCLERRAFAGMGAPDPDTQQIARLVEGLKLSDRRAVELVLGRKNDFRQELETLLVAKPGEFQNLVAILDRPDRQDNLPLENSQAVHYAHKIVESLRGFSKEDVDSTVNLLAPLSLAERQQIETELGGELQKPFRDWLHEQKQNESIARIEATLDHPDSATDYKGSIKVLMGGLKDNWSANNENAILHIVSGMNNKEIRDAGLMSDLQASPNLSKAAKDALDVTLTGNDRWTADAHQARELAEIALKAKNLEMFKDAMQSPAAREYFRSKEGAKKIDDVYSGPFDSRDKQVAHDYAELNDTKLLTDLQMYQFSLSPSREAITQRLQSATEDEKRLFQQGRSLADLRPKETEEEKAANRYYLEVYDALRSASKYDSNQLKEWTGILLDKHPDKLNQEKSDARQQILDMNKRGATGLDAIRQLEDILKKNPYLISKLDGQDKELQTALTSTLKKVSEDSRNAAIAGNMWKEATDINNLNPISAMMAAPDRMRRQGELAQDISSSAEDNLTKQLLANGQLSLEQKLFIAGNRKLSAEDLLSLSTDERQRLLKGNFSPQIQETVFGKGSENEFVRSVLEKQDTKLTTLDHIRAFSLGRGASPEQIEMLMGQMPANQRRELSNQYFDKYHSVMHSDILQQVKDPVDRARILQSLKHVNETAEQKLIDTQIEQVKHASAFDGLSEAYSPDQRMATRYSRAAESFYRQVKDGLTDQQKEALDKISPDKKQEIASALVKYQSALKKYWSAQKDYTRNKEEMAEQLADATLTAGAVIASIAQPELSPALLARTTVLSAAGRLGIKQAVMDKDFDFSSASIQKELFKGGLAGVINTTTGFGTGRLLPMGKFANATEHAAEKTIADLASNQALKSVLKEDAEQILSESLKKTSLEKVFGKETVCLADAKLLAKSITSKANEEQLDIIAKAIQSHRKQEILNTLKGRLWHESDQFTQSMTASVAGSAFAELGSTAAGYESPDTLWKRLELSSQAAVAGGALFHVGFKAAGAGMHGVGGMFIGKERDGRLFAGPGTTVRTAEGKEITVGKERYHFHPGDNIVESHRDTRPKIDAPPFVDTPAPRQLSSSLKGKESGKFDSLTTSETKPVIVDKYDKIPAEYRQKLFSINNEYLDFLKDHYQQELNFKRTPEDRAIIGQLVEYVDDLQRLREQAAEKPRKLSRTHSRDGLIDKLPHVANQQPESPPELFSPRSRVTLSQEALNQMSEIYMVPKDHLVQVQSSPTHEIQEAILSYERKLADGTAQKRSDIEHFLLVLKLAKDQRTAHFRHTYPMLSPGTIDSSITMNLTQLSEYKRDVLDPLIRSNQKPNAVELYKQQRNLLTELEAEHLSQALDENLKKRTISGPPDTRQEIRLLWQYPLKDLREAINFIQKTPVPADLRPARSELIDSRLARYKGLPKSTGAPVQITEDLAVIPWRDGEMISRKNGDITVNDKIGRTSFTINNSGQLIELLKRDGSLWHFEYANSTTTEVLSATLKLDDRIMRFHHDGSSFNETITKSDGGSVSTPNKNIVKIETRADGTYAVHKKDEVQIQHPDGSRELEVPGKRTTHTAILEAEQFRLKNNYQEALSEIPRRKRTLGEVLQTDELLTNRKRRFNNLIKEFESTNKLPEEEKAQFYKHLNRILDNKKDSAIPSRSGRVDLAEQVLYNATHARSIDQGDNNTCNVTTVEKRCWARDPVAMAQFAADVAQDGKYTTTSGHVLDMTQISHGIRPDIQSRKSLRLQREGKESDIVIDGQRSWLSQITQIAMANSAWKLRAPAVTPDGFINPKNILFDSKKNLLGKADMQDIQTLHDEKGKLLDEWPADNKVYDKGGKLLALKPEDVLYNFGSELVGTVDRSKIAPVYNRDNQIVSGQMNEGDVVYDSPGGLAVMRVTHPGEITYGKSGNPSKNATQELDDHERLILTRHNTRSYCKTGDDGGIVSHPVLGLKALKYVSEEFTGKDESFLVRRRPQGGTGALVEDISTRDELEKLLKKWQTDNHLPGIIAVHAGKPPFNKSFDPNDIAGALKHEWHVINVWGIENGMVDITNQWGKKNNIKVPIEQLFEAMIDPEGTYFR